VKVNAGVSLTIPVGTHFQFRNTGAVPLRFVIATMPQWPGSDEAVRVEDHWRG
jgi:mannose-6-phosphate isomerase-like protein (cupin superfamily)